jgi:hypothetical protein
MSATEWVPTPGDCDDGEFGGMKIGRGNRSTRRNPAPAPLCPPQIPLARPGIEPGPSRWQASDYPLELWGGFFSIPSLSQASFKYP